MTETAPKLIKPHCGTQPLAPRKDKYGDWHMECRKCGGATIGGTHRATVSRWNDGQFNHRRPNPETQAVALAREHETGHAAAEQSAVRFLKAHLATLTHTEAVADCLHCSLNYLISRFIDKHRALSALLESPRSPVESVPVSVLRELEAEWLAECADKGIAQPIAAAIRKQCADRLSAIVKENSKWPTPKL